jgi:hypothetical protein
MLVSENKKVYTGRQRKRVGKNPADREVAELVGPLEPEPPRTT